LPTSLNCVPVHAGWPPRVLVGLLGVEDADAALARIAKLGGKVVRPAEDTPYGRHAVATDPTA
jgi:predicted enzyme related to lactoylglutathione lyase